MELWIWFGAAGILLLIELLTADLLFASLGASALAAALTAAAGGDLVLQAVAFGVVAVLTLALLRPIALKHMKRRGPDAATNVEALLGSDALSLSKITNQAGQVKLSGEVWSARVVSGEIASNKKVVVREIRGATAIVEEA